MNTPTDTYRRVTVRRPPPLLKGIDARVNGLTGVWHRRPGIVAQLRADAEKVDSMASEWVGLHDRQLRQRLRTLRERVRRGGKDVEACILPALAGIREEADRKLGLRPFIVQLMGALALHRGYLAEMATGEGKTLTAGLAAVLAGWTGRPCHIVTVNDYLVQRDSEWMEPLYRSCGVHARWVTGSMKPEERREAYNADITYVTSKELLADFLRDRLALNGQGDFSRRLLRELVHPGMSAGGDRLVMRGLDSCIVDEADSVLIDEAVTPLIISAARENEMLKKAIRSAQHIVDSLEAGVDYRPNPRYREVDLTETGRDKLDVAGAALEGLWRGTQRRDELVKQALVAREFFLRDRHYIIADGKIVIVDESTGRQMPQRTWRQGLHQAVEAKEGLEISDPSETAARLSFQRFFRCFRKLSGMTGTAREAAAEFWQVYGLSVVTIPVNRPCIRERWPDRIFPTDATKWEAVANEIQRLHATGRPVLVGTRSVATSERLAEKLSGRGLAYTVLNAVRHREEASIVSRAGERGQITVATNMAGRGTDIKLGSEVAALGGLHVLATERHDSERVDRQLFGRAGRQGDPGSVQTFLSVEDDLLHRYLPKFVGRPLGAIARGGYPGWHQLARGAFAATQVGAEHEAAKQRKEVLRSDTWLEESLSFTDQEQI